MTTARERFGFLTGVVIAILVVGLLGVWVTRSQPDPGPIAKAGIPATAADTEPDDDANEERDEQAEGVEQRVEAWKEAAPRRPRRPGREARRISRARQRRRRRAGRARFPIDTMVDDWEPAIAADPHGPYVYVLTTRYGTDKPCPGNCPTPFIALVTQRGQRRHVEPEPAALRLQGQGPVRPDHRGRPEQRQRLLPVHDRIQRLVHEVDRPRRHLVAGGQDVRQRVLE